ncbi:MAG: flavodoxin family protein [Bacteroidales bacterium]|nr:flavodoxin family protein [Bacteroidales bacterium]
MLKSISSVSKFLSLICLLALPLASCSSNQEKAEAEMPNYHINFSETSHIQKAHKKVLIISGSPRKGGNTDLLCDEFARGAEEAGGIVEKIFLADYNINYFTEADEQRTGDSAHVAQDDAPMLVDKLVEADIIVLASPVYFMNITGQMKTFIDRTFSRFMDIKDKEFFYITACADPAESTADYAINGLRGFVMCLPNPTERGSVKAIGMGRKGGVKQSQFMDEAYQLGKKI